MEGKQNRSVNFLDKSLPFLQYILLPVITGIGGLIVQYYFNVLSEQDNFIVICIYGVLILSFILISWFGYFISDKLTSEVESLKSINSVYDSLSRIGGINVISSSFQINDQIGVNTNSLMAHYSSISKLIQNAEKSIIIFNYIDSHPAINSILSRLQQKDQEKYNQCTKIIKDYYDMIESKIQYAGLDYTRVTMLPLSYPPLKNIEHDYSNQENTKLSSALNQLTKSHLDNCTKMKNTVNGNVHIKILPFAALNYSFAVIDGQDVVIELDRYNITGYSFSNQILGIKDKIDGEIVKSFTKIANTYTQKAFEFKSERDWERSIGEIKNTHIQLNEQEIKTSITNYAEQCTP
jgi:hypothetical protein